MSVNQTVINISTLWASHPCIFIATSEKQCKAAHSMSEFELVYLLMNFLKLRFKIHPIDSVGMTIDDINNTVIGGFLSKNLDLSFPQVTMYVSRSKAMDFVVPPLRYSGWAFVINPGKQSDATIPLTAPFSPMVWVVGAVSYLIVAIILTCWGKVERSTSSSSHLCLRSAASSIFHLFHNPLDRWTRKPFSLFVLLWTQMAVIGLGVYQSKFMEHFSPLSSYQSPFRSSAELVSALLSKQYKLIIGPHEKFNLDHLLYDAQPQSGRAKLDSLISSQAASVVEHDNVLWESSVDMVARTSHSVTIIEDLRGPNTKQKYPHLLLKTIDDFPLDIQAMVIQKNHILREKITRATMNLVETGIWSRLENIKVKEEVQSFGKEEPITTANFLPLIKFFGATYAVILVVFCLELIVARFKTVGCIIKMK